MRILMAITLFAVACGGTQPKKESAIVSEGDTSPNCCCKTLPTTAEKELVPEYTMKERMECSAAKGDCVDEVQCSSTEGGTQPAATEGGSVDGVPPPPVIEPTTEGIE